MTKRHRRSLEEMMAGEQSAAVAPAPASMPIEAKETVVAASPVKRSRAHVKQQTAYLPLAVHKQLRELAFTEERKMHDLLMEGLDLLFRNRGLPSIDDLTDR